MIVSKSHTCPYRQEPHQNLAYVEYHNGAWCYSCNRGEFKDRSLNPFTREMKVDDNFSITYSIGITTSIKEFSNIALSWLYSYYVFDDMIKKYNIACGLNDVLLFPVLDQDNKMIAYQERELMSKRFSSSKNLKEHIFDVGHHDTDTVVIVEDYISAIRVGETENCIWLVGTYLRDDVLEYIVDKYSHIKIWLDGDEPGVVAAKKVYRKLYKEFLVKRSFSNFKITTINTEKDPKCYTDTEIRQILDENNG